MKFTIRINLDNFFGSKIFEIVGTGQSYVYVKGFVDKEKTSIFTPADYYGNPDTRLNNFAKRFYK